MLISSKKMIFEFFLMPNLYQPFWIYMFLTADEGWIKVLNSFSLLGTTSEMLIFLAEVDVKSKLN